MDAFLPQNFSKQHSYGYPSLHSRLEFKNVYFEDIPVHTMKAYCVIKEGTTPSIRNLSAGWR